jgi:hypothetical protein
VSPNIIILSSVAVVPKQTQVYEPCFAFRWTIMKAPLLVTLWQTCEFLWETKKMQLLPLVVLHVLLCLELPTSEI